MNVVEAPGKRLEPAGQKLTMVNFLRELVEAYYTSFADAPELIPDLCAAPLRWDKELQLFEAKQELREFDEGAADVNQ